MGRAIISIVARPVRPRETWTTDVLALAKLKKRLALYPERAIERVLIDGVIRLLLASEPRRRIPFARQIVYELHETIHEHPTPEKEEEDDDPTKP